MVGIEVFRLDGQDGAAQLLRPSEIVRGKGLECLAFGLLDLDLNLLYPAFIM
jgi:hypothetical protein